MNSSGTNRRIPTTCLWIAGSIGGVVAVWMWPREGAEATKSVAPQAPLALIEKIPLPSGPERQVSDEIERAVSPSSALDRTSRLESLRIQDGALGPVETDLLLGELLHPESSGENKDWESEYFHEVCLLLHRNGDGKEKLARVLATVARDATRDLRVRDYAVQHLRTVWASARDGIGLRKSIEATFHVLLKDYPQLASSALLSLHLLGSDFNRGLAAEATDRQFAVPDSEMIPAVTEIVNEPDPEYRRTSIRMTALRVISDRKIESLLPDVRKMAASEEGEHAVTRMAAIAALARFAEPEDRILLESMGGTDPRIASALKHALTRIP